MGLIEELNEIDNERGRNREIAYENKEKKQEYIAKKSQLRNTERLKKILEDDNPELDKPDLFKIIEFKNHSRHGDIYTNYKVLTGRAVKVLKLIEEWRVERWEGDEKTIYERSYRKPSREQQETMRYIEKKVKKIYSSNEGNNKCMVAIDEKIISPNGDLSEWGILPRVQIGPYYNGYEGLVADTKLKYALLANLGERSAFQLITQEPEKIQNYENKIENARTTIKDYEEMHPKQEGNSKITFATIKSAIKKRLIGKGER